jgi:hypothetical protein
MIPMCPDCLVPLIKVDNGWFCPYAIAAKAAKEKEKKK